MDLAQFLTARFDEDAAVARAVRFERFEAFDYLWYAKYLELQGEGSSKATGDLPPEVADHAARHDPARVLAEVNAKREVVNAYERAVAEFQDSGPAMVSYDRLTGSVSSLRTALEFLALPYVNHPDYQDTWRP
ncbi:DUF6221 family protein [Streptomyces sp. NPDC096068]|uniref:DUF6221 family protein n=1 Tax=Streptomyces sp. NPDC096068 TaxID=3155424 RepID=UPI00331E3684